jgi:hypothetical protein
LTVSFAAFSPPPTDFCQPASGKVSNRIGLVEKQKSEENALAQIKNNPYFCISIKVQTNLYLPKST